MREYTKVSPSVWHSERFRNLPSDDGRFLYLYLVTCEHQNSAGCYRLLDGYAIADLNWAVDRYRKARAELVAANLVKFDTTASVVKVTNWFRFNPPMNEKHLKGIVGTLQRLPSQSIREDAYAELQAFMAPPDTGQADGLGMREKSPSGGKNPLACCRFRGQALKLTQPSSRTQWG